MFKQDGNTLAVTLYVRDRIGQVLEMIELAPYRWESEPQRGRNGRRALTSLRSPS